MPSRSKLVYLFRIGTLDLCIDSEMADLGMIVNRQIGCGGGWERLRLGFDTNTKLSLSDVSIM